MAVDNSTTTDVTDRREPLHCRLRQEARAFLKKCFIGTSRPKVKVFAPEKFSMGTYTDSAAIRARLKALRE